MAESRQLIDTLTFKTIRSEVNSFDSRKHLFDFGIDSDFSLNENKAIPTLEEQYHQKQSGLHYDLGEGMRQAIDNNRMIANNNFGNVNKRVWSHFLHMLSKEKTVAEEEPHFVTLSRLLSDLFVVEEWETTFFALKSKGVIYLFRHKSIEIEERADDGGVKDHDCYLVKFHYLITGRDDSDMNAFERCLSVDRIDLNGTKLIVCHEMPAKDKNGSTVYYKCRQINERKDKEYKYNLLRDWANSMVAGAQTFVLGKRRHNGSLEEVDVMDFNSIWNPLECRAFWCPSKCLSFADQSLQFIKSCVKSEDQLYEFAINPRDKTISCFRHEPNPDCNYFLPNSYPE